MNLEYMISEELRKKFKLLTWRGENFRDDFIGLLPLPIVLHFTHSV